MVCLPMVLMHNLHLIYKSLHFGALSFHDGMEGYGWTACCASPEQGGQIDGSIAILLLQSSSHLLDGSSRWSQQIEEAAAEEALALSVDFIWSLPWLVLGSFRHQSTNITAICSEVLGCYTGSPLHFKLKQNNPDMLIRMCMCKGM